MRSLAIIFGSILMVAFVAVASPMAAEISVPGDFDTIDAAIKGSKPGDTVLVGEGVYSENLLIDSSIVLVARGARERTVIEPASASEPVIMVDGVDGLTLSGFTIRGSSVEGIYVKDSNAVKLLKLSLTGNETGIFYERSREGIIAGNEATGNQKGIYLIFSDNNTIEENSADTNINNGILLHASHGNVIRSNKTNSNLWNGITLSSSNNNQVYENISVKNAYAIVVSESVGNEIRDNKTRRRLYLILPFILVYLAIAVYLVERKLFLLYYRIKYKEKD